MAKLSTIKTFVTENISAGNFGSVEFMTELPKGYKSAGNKHHVIQKHTKVCGIQFCSRENRAATKELRESGVEAKQSYTKVVEGFEGILSEHKTSGVNYLAIQITPAVRTVSEFFIDGVPATKLEVDELLVNSRKSTYPKRPQVSPMINIKVDNVMAINGTIVD